ncbi:MAG: DUF4340 domain-containing protein [Bacteroidetes bacterium]|nr:MAG: DUF4340 domain-containing protein [Bacteroidota bacterium]
MFRKLNIKILLSILLALIGVIVLVFMLDEKKGGRTIREELVRLDSASVTSILLYPQSDKHAEIKFFKEGARWKVQKEKIMAEADSNGVRNLINTFKLIKPQRLASSEKSKWKDYSTDDSLGTRVKFFSGDKLYADVVVGKFSYNNNTRLGISYLRLYNEEGVYAVDGFIPMEVNQPFNQWRNKLVFKGEKNNFTKLTFNYPADSGFVLQKENGKWKADTAFADSAKVDQYLNTISYASSTSFADACKETSPIMALSIEGNNMNRATIGAFLSDSIQRFILHSSNNPEAYFSAGNEKIDEKFFKGKNYFLPIVIKEKSVKKK